MYYVTLPRANLAVANAGKAAAVTAIQDNLDGVTAVAGADGSGGTGLATITVTGSLVFRVSTLAKANTILALNIGASAQRGSGNLYGSSKDIGTISGKMPVLSETGGRVNRVGFKRKELEGTFEKFGFFDEYTQESMDFDSDADLMTHINREMVSGANEMTEDALQIDLINAAGVLKYAGDATSNAEIGSADLVSYGDIMRLSIDLDNNRTPKHTTVITGTRLVDTRVLPAARIMYIGSELLPTLKAMVDLHGNPAFIEIQKYAAGGATVTGEAGSIDQFRVVVVPEMMKWAGAGADASADATMYETAGRYDVFPMLVVGDASFTTIGFQTDGKTVKFKIYHKAPGEATADRNDPYGEMGFMSIKWYYGFMALRPERIAVIRTSAKL
jgi:N4-gp56 family major capsid protein